MSPSTTRPQTIADLEGELLSGSPMSYIPVADAMRVRGHLPQALEVCQRGISSGLGTVAGHILLARIHFDMGKYDLAERACEKALEAAPASSGARRLLIQTSLKRRLYIRALSLIEELGGVHEDPDLCAAFVEAQRGLSEKFAREIATGSHVQGLRPAPFPLSPEEILAQIRARPEVLECHIVGDDDTESPWGAMLREWKAVCEPPGRGTVRLCLLEAKGLTLLTRDLGAVGGTLVVGLMRNASFGPVKHLADLMASKSRATPEPAESTTCTDEGQHP